MYISKSSLGAFLQCPRRFQYNYIDKIKSPSSPQAERGIAVHEFCNRFYDNIKFRNGRFIVDEGFLSDTLNTATPDAKLCMENFIEFEFKRWDACKVLNPLNPKKLFMPLLRESKFFSDKLEQVTIVDRLDQRLDGNYTLVEYKSERFQPKGWKLTELRRELCFEKTTCETSPEFMNLYPNNILDFVVYFPRSNDIIMEGFNWRSMKALQNAIEKMRLAVELKDYPCNVNYHCRYCSYNLSCNMEMSS